MRIVIELKRGEVGEVMGVGATFGEAFIKSQLAAGDRLPVSGKVFVSVRDADKRAVVPIAQELVSLGFHLVATRGTASALAAAGIAVTPINKVAEGRPHVVDMIKNDEVTLVINTTEGRQSIADSWPRSRSEAWSSRTTIRASTGSGSLSFGSAVMPRNRSTCARSPSRRWRRSPRRHTRR